MERNLIRSIPETIEFQSALRADHNPLFTKFWQELLSGKGVEKGEADVEELIAAYTYVETLCPLSEEEIIKIKEHLRCFFRSYIERYNRMYNTFINDKILLFGPNDSDVSAIRDLIPSQNSPVF